MLIPIADEPALEFFYMRIKGNTESYSTFHNVLPSNRQCLSTQMMKEEPSLDLLDCVTFLTFKIVMTFLYNYFENDFVVTDELDPRLPKFRKER